MPQWSSGAPWPRLQRSTTDICNGGQGCKTIAKPTQGRRKACPFQRRALLLRAWSTFSLSLSLCLLSQPLFASVGQVSARFIASLTWSLFTSRSAHRLVLLCVDAHCFVFWDVPGDGLAAPESALCGWIGCHTSLSPFYEPSALLGSVLYTALQQRLAAPARPSNKRERERE